MTDAQLRLARRAAMERGDHYGVVTCNRALAAAGAEREDLVATIVAHEALRERVFGGEA